MGDKTKAQVARELGIRVNQLRQWRLEFEEAMPLGSASRLFLCSWRKQTDAEKHRVSRTC
jgi:transposase-like protein